MGDLVKRFKEVTDRIVDSGAGLSVALAAQQFDLGERSVKQLNKASYDLTCGDEDPTLAEEVVTTLEAQEAEIARLREENAILRTEKHADGECIGHLREAVREAADKFHVFSFYIKDKEAHECCKAKVEEMRAALSEGEE